VKRERSPFLGPHLISERVSPQPGAAGVSAELILFVLPPSPKPWRSRPSEAMASGLAGDHLTPSAAPVIRDVQSRAFSLPIRDADRPWADRIEQLIGGQGLTPFHGGGGLRQRAPGVHAGRYGRAAGWLGLGADGAMRALLALHRIGPVSQLPLPGRAAASRSGGARNPAPLAGMIPELRAAGTIAPLRFRGADAPETGFQLHVCLSGTQPPCSRRCARCGAHLGLRRSGLPTVARGRRGAATFLAGLIGRTGRWRDFAPRSISGSGASAACCAITAPRFVARPGKVALSQ